MLLDVKQAGCHVVQGRAFVGCPGDSPVWVAMYFTLAVLNFEFGRRSGSPIVFVFSLLQFKTRNCETSRLRYSSSINAALKRQL